MRCLHRLAARRRAAAGGGGRGGRPGARHASQPVRARGHLSSCVLACLHTETRSVWACCCSLAACSCSEPTSRPGCSLGEHLLKVWLPWLPWLPAAAAVRPGGGSFGLPSARSRSRHWWQGWFAAAAGSTAKRTSCSTRRYAQDVACSQAHPGARGLMILVDTTSCKQSAQFGCAGACMSIVEQTRLVGCPSCMLASSR